MFQQKQLENDLALTQLPALIDRLDSLSWAERQMSIVCGILAGNVFDWGAQEVVSLMEKADGGLSFEAALDKLQRMWLYEMSML